MSVNRTVAAVGAGAAAAWAGEVAQAAWELNLPPAVSPLGQQIHDLHMLILWICVAIGVGVFSVMFYSIWKHRKSRGSQAAHFHENTSVEIIWTVIPFLILVGIAIPATRTLIAMENTANADVTVKVTGYQWKWKYDYLDEDVSFFSTLSTPWEAVENRQPKGEHYLLEVDNELVLPVQKKVRFLFTANDVLHAWWVPMLGVKKDAIPGYINESWTYIEQPGIYRGQCAELCGKGHAFMPVVVRAVSQDEYQQWLKEHRTPGAVAGAAVQTAAQSAGAAPVTSVAQAQTPTAGAAPPSGPLDKEALMLQKGEQVYKAHCAACHGPEGQGTPPAFPPLKGGKIATGPVQDHLNIVLKGKPGTAMAAFGAQLKDDELAAVITYERNALGNNVGDMVQPADVQAAR